MLDRRREQDVERQPERARPQSAPAQPLQVGTLGWASAVGNQAVARLARETAEAEVEAVEVPPEAEEAAAAAAPPDAEQAAAPDAEAVTDMDASAAEAPALEDLPEELPE